MVKTTTKPNKNKIALIAICAVIVLVAFGVGIFAVLNANKQLSPKEAFTACKGKLPQSADGDIIGVSKDSDGFYAKVQDADEYAGWSSCISRKLGISEEEWSDITMEQNSPQNPTPKELKQISKDTVDFLTYAFFTNDDESTIMSKLPESISKLGNYASLSELPDNFTQEYVYRSQFFRVYDFDDFSVLSNRRPDDYTIELIVYAKTSNRLPVVANACGTMYSNSRQSSFEMPNEYTVEISQPFFALDDISAFIENTITIFDSFSCVHTILGVFPEWSSEDAWEKFIGDNGDDTQFLKRWGNYRLNLNLQYNNGDYEFKETITEI